MWYTSRIIILLEKILQNNSPWIDLVNIGIEGKILFNQELIWNVRQSENLLKHCLHFFEAFVPKQRLRPIAKNPGVQTVINSNNCLTELSVTPSILLQADHRTVDSYLDRLYYIFMIFSKFNLPESFLFRFFQAFCFWWAILKMCLMGFCFDVHCFFPPHVSKIITLLNTEFPI